jgi:hypothetical protein
MEHLSVGVALALLGGLAMAGCEGEKPPPPAENNLSIVGVVRQPAPPSPPVPIPYPNLGQVAKTSEQGSTSKVVSIKGVGDAGGGTTISENDGG